MKKFNLIVVLILFSIKVSAQIDGSLLLGLTPIANVDIATITSPPEGALFYNTDEQRIYLNTALGFIEIPSLDTNSIDFWSALGSIGTNPAVNFLGTTDAQDMVFRANNEERLRLSGANQTVLLNGAAQFNNHPFIIRANGNDIMGFQTAAGATEWHWNLLGNGLNFVETGVADYRIFMEQGGNIGLSTGVPTERLDVDGSVRIRDITTSTADLDVLVTTATGVVQKRVFADFIGPQGIPGNNGADGNDGSDGISVTNATINGSDELILNLSDTSTINAGVVVGTDGAQGIPGNNGADGSNGADGISITAATLNVNKELILTLSDASIINAGQVIEPKLNFGGRWTNTNTTTNLNVNNTVAPIFGAEDYKDDGNILYEVIGNTLTVKENGRYDIKVNLSFLNISVNRNSPNARIAVNGTQIGARAASGYIRNANGQRQSSIHINETLNLNANDVVSVIMFREANGGNVRFNAANQSSFIINKLR